MSGQVWFNAAEVDPSQQAAQFPVGVHTGIIIDGKREATKNDANSGMMVFTIKIVDGPLTGTQGAYRLNLWNASEVAKGIAQKQLSALCHVTGAYHLSTQNGAELFNRPFKFQVSQQKNNPEYTQIDGVFLADGSTPKWIATQPPGQAQQPQQPAQQPNYGQAQPQVDYNETIRAAQAALAAQAQQQAPPAQPSWGSPQVGGGPMQQPGQPAQPAQGWTQPPTAGKPSWAS